MSEFVNTDPYAVCLAHLVNKGELLPNATIQDATSYRKWIGAYCPDCPHVQDCPVLTTERVQKWNS